MKLLPTKCPSCKTPLQWTQNRKGVKVDLFCANNDCTGSELRRMTHFFNVLITDGITKTTVENLIAAGLDTIPKILNADKKQLSHVDGFASKKVANLLLSLKKIVANIPLAKLMHASGIFADTSIGIGQGLIAPIIDKLTQKEVLTGKIDPLKWKLKIVSLPNLGHTRAQLFIDNLPKFREFYSELSTVSLATGGGKLSGRVYCFTGYRDNELQIKIEANGGRVSPNMSKAVNVLFAAAPSPKTETAEKYGTKTVMRKDVEKYMKGFGL